MPEVKEQAKDPIAEMAEEAFEELKQGGQPAGRAEKGKGTMLPTKKTPPKVSLSDQTVLVHGRPKIGKCLKGDTLIVDPGNGRPISLHEFVERRNGNILTMREAGVIASQRPSAYLANEPAQLYRLTTQTGRTIEATANHPFLTREGWKPLSELGPSDRVAVVAEYPSLFGQGHTDDALVKILACLIADGGLSGSCPIFTKKDPEVRMDFEAAVEAKGDECVEFASTKGVTSVRVRGKQGSANNVTAYLKQVGIDGLRSPEKFIPEFVFGLKKRKLSLFLNRLFTCDGSAEASGRISYSSTSIRMVRQVQHLLSRFGIVSLIRKRHRGGAVYGAELVIASKANVLRFIDEIGFLGEKAAVAESIRASFYNVRGAETQIDRLGPVIFDRVLSVEPTEIAPVYDLTVEGSHNFIADDFVVHNSTLCSGAPDAIFIATEAGLNSLEVFQVPVSNWQEFLNVCREIAEGNHGFKTVVVDTLDNAFRMCSEFIRAKHKIEHESDLPYGKGFSFVYNEFYRVLNKLSLLPYGLYLICHSQEKELETRTGKRTRIVPTLPDKARRMVLGMVDIILYCDVETAVGPDGKPAERRIMRTRPSENYEAGDRTGRLPEVVNLDYQKFVAAFEGKAVEEAAPTPKPDKRQFATDAQVKEFEELTSALGIAPDVVKQRLAQFGATEPYGVERDAMEKILAKLRSARAKAGEAEQEK